ncbi:MAG: LLM class flavin-dependent oxidoreductase, partial [Actinobacteria bacterium]|nr:LLM class flavin-dependent oxidoreductase [Actinomycetota bacterium]
MQLGLQLGYWGQMPSPDWVDRAVEAERLGFTSVWTAEAWGSDALTPLAFLAAKTDRIRLGTSVM